MPVFYGPDHGFEDFVRSLDDPIEGLRRAVNSARSQGAPGVSEEALANAYQKGVGTAQATAPPPAATGGTAAPSGVPSGRLVPIDDRGRMLDANAAAAFNAAKAELARMGVPISVASAYRTPAQQYKIYQSGQRPAAPAGLASGGVPAGAVSDGTYWSKSMHSKGLAVDLNTPSNGAAVRAVFAKYGFHQFNPRTDPWHFSYGVVG